MITEWFLGLAATVTDWFWSLWPDWTPPAFLSGLGDQINAVLANVAGLGAWVDWVFVIPIAGAVFLVWGVGLAIKTARAVASYVPFFGGAG